MITLASTSQIRQQMLKSAKVDFVAQDSGFDEAPMKNRLLESGASPAEVALALASGKAQVLAGKTDGIVLGCDQVLAFEGRLLSKSDSLEHARHQLTELKGKEHVLLSAAVIYERGEQVWSHVGQVRLHMRFVSDDYLSGYLDRNWPGIQNAVGGYKLEEEGVRLFSRIEGDYFTVLGMPLVEILGYLGQRGTIEI